MLKKLKLSWTGFLDLVLVEHFDDLRWPSNIVPLRVLGLPIYNMMWFYEVDMLDMALRNYELADSGPRARPASSSGRSVEERGVDCTEGSYFSSLFSMYWG